MAVFDFDHRLRFYKPKPGYSSLDWGITNLKGGLVNAPITVDEIPDFLREPLKHWIALAQNPASESPMAERRRACPPPVWGNLPTALNWSRRSGRQLELA
jgi:hypothetical protein